MPVNRRRFLAGAGASLVTGGLAAARSPVASASRPAAAPADPSIAPAQPDLRDWGQVRQQFDLSPDLVHLSNFFIAPHPRPVREAIERHRRAIDADPFGVVERGLFGSADENIPARVKAEVAAYLGGAPEEIALTGSTTMGLALIYQGLPIGPGDEILTTAHDHYSHHESIRLAAAKSGATVRKIALFDRIETVSADGIVDRIRRALTPRTRAVGITWVHSSTGLRLPVRRIADVIGEANSGRGEAGRALLIVDGVHGLGAVDETVAEMGCDFFASGTHKWMFGPRGTGLIRARPAAWAAMRPTIPTFDSTDPYEAWMRDEAPSPPARAAWFSPGGFHAFEHQWAVDSAFRFHRQIGRKRIADRIQALNDQCKEGLARMPRVRLHTPRDGRLSAGIVCFDIEGMKPEQVVHRLLERRIVASVTPYGRPHARVAGSIVNTPEEIDIFLGAARALANA